MRRTVPATFRQAPSSCRNRIRGQVNYRIEDSPDWSRVLRPARSARREVIAACLEYVERLALQVLRDNGFTRVDVVEEWSKSREAEPLVAEAQANDDLYLDALDALDGPMTPEVMRGFAHRSRAHRVIKHCNYGSIYRAYGGDL